MTAVLGTSKSYVNSRSVSIANMELNSSSETNVDAFGVI